MSDLDELAEKIAAKITPPDAPPAHTAMNWSSLWSVAPAWLSLLAALVLGFSNLHTRVSTIEYQAIQGQQEHKDFRDRLNKGDDAVSSLRADIREVKTMLDEMVRRKNTL